MIKTWSGIFDSITWVFDCQTISVCRREQPALLSWPIRWLITGYFNLKRIVIITINDKLIILPQKDRYKSNVYKSIKKHKKKPKKNQGKNF